MGKKFLNYEDKAMEEEIKSFIKKGLSYGGCLSILFHNHYFWINTRSRLKMYDRILNFLKESDITVGPCRDIYFWRKDQTTLKIQYCHNIVL